MRRVLKSDHSSTARHIEAIAMCSPVWLGFPTGISFKFDSLLALLKNKKRSAFSRKNKKFTKNKTFCVVQFQDVESLLDAIGNVTGARFLHHATKDLFELTSA